MQTLKTRLAVLCLHAFITIIIYMGLIIAPTTNVWGQATYYVGGSGASDSNPGNSSQPFATIQKAATVAQPGDVVTINTGIFRETITPTNAGTSVSPIIYQACTGCTVVVSGADAISDGSWTVHSGNIYKTTLALPSMFDEYLTGFNVATGFITSNTEMLAQQIFKNGVMQSLASYPKTPTATSLMERSTQRGRSQTVSFTQTSINDTALGSLTNLAGAYVWVNGWFLTYTRQISSHSSNTISFSSTDPNIKFSTFYRVTGKLGLLTQAGEWHWESNTLYYWQSGGGSPTGMEYKKRNWGFDLRGKGNIKIRGLSFNACDPVVADAAAVNVEIDNIRATYMNHTYLETRGGNNGYHDSAIQTGMKLGGAGSSVKNSEFRYAAGCAIWAGPNTTIQNNYFSDIDYDGQYSAAVKLIWGADNVKILNNTGTRMGRGFIELSQETSDPALNIEIGYNDISMCNMLNVDGGAIYSSRNLNHAGMVIHHNWFHDSGANRASEGPFDGILVTGVYFDQAAGPATLHHNVHWNGFASVEPGSGNVYSADFYNDTNYSGSNGGSNLYSNVFASTGTYSSYVEYDVSPVDVQRNNIYRNGIWIGPGGGSLGNIANSLTSGTNPLFNGGSLSTPATYFGLQSGSPAVSYGTAIPGITTDAVGTPDAGAYERGATPWTAGYTAVSLPPVGEIITTLNDTQVGNGQNQFEYVGSGWDAGPNSGAYQNDEHYTKITNDYYLVDFTGSQIQVYSQKFSSLGITAYSIDGGAETNVDHYNSTLLLNTLVYTSPALTNASHTLKVRVTGTKNSSASDYWMTADRVAITTPAAPVDPPSFNPMPGVYSTPQTVAITTTTSGASVRYTTDGSTPTASSTLYTGPISVSLSTVLKAIGIKSGLSNSTVAIGEYTIQNATTTINNTVTGTGQNQFEYVGSWSSGSNTGAYLNDEHYTATTNNYYMVDFTGTQIQVFSQKFNSQGIAAYSIDGGAEVNVDHYNPTVQLNTLVYTSPMLTNGSHTLKVRVTGTKSSSSSSYWLVADRVVITTPLPAVATPSFSPVAGTYTSTQSVTISCATSGATIRYTTDGSTPTSSSMLYTGPVTVSSSKTIKAIGIKSLLANSDIATAAYTIQTLTTINNSVTGTGQNQFEYVGAGWGTGANTGAYLNDEHYTNTTNSYYQVDFTGSKIEVYAQKYFSNGINAYSIDGGAETLVDHYNASLLLNTLVYTSPALIEGPHTLKVRVTGTKNASASSYWLVADRVVITSSASGGGGARMAMSPNSNDKYLSTGSPNETPIDELPAVDGSLVFPNPSTGIFFLSEGQNIKAVEIYSVGEGKKYALSPAASGQSNEVNITAFSNGAYLLKLFDGRKYYFVRIIKEN